MAMAIPLLASIGGGSALAGGALVASTVGTGLSALSEYRTGQATDIESKRRADQEEFSGEVRALQQAKRLNQSLASMNVAAATSGIRAGSGSPQNIIQKSIREGELEQKLGQAGTRGRVSLIRSGGKAARQVGTIKGLAGLVKMGSQVSSGYQSYKTSKGP